MLAIGMPLAMLFFDPQNTMAISSSFSKPSARLASVVKTRIRARISVSVASRTASFVAVTCDQTPATMPSLNAA